MPNLAKPEVGDIMDLWFNHQAVVVAVQRYQGRYTQWFHWDVTVTNLRGGLTRFAL